MGKTGKTGMIPVPAAGGSAALPTRKKKNNALLWGAIAVLIVGSGVGLYFALREKPPRHVNIDDMERDMMNLLDEHFIRANEPFDVARHEYSIWYYKPIEGSGPDATSKYRLADPVPVSEQQDRFVWDRDAIIIKGLPCNTHREDVKTFDEEHLNLGKELIKFDCNQENLIYFLSRPNIYKDYCIRCGRVYELAATPKPPEVTSEKWNPDERKKEQTKTDEKFYSDIAAKYAIAPAELQKRVSHALMFAPVWPENVNEIPEEERVPAYYKGTVRYLKVKYFLDPAPRINRIKAEEPNPIRFEKIWPAEYEDNGKMVRMGTQLFRRGQVWLHEANFEYRKGNIIWTDAGGPAGVVLQEVHEFVETEELLAAKAKKEAEEAQKRAKAKKKAAEAPAEKKPDEPKPEEKK